MKTKIETSETNNKVFVEYSDTLSHEEFDMFVEFLSLLKKRRYGKINNKINNKKEIKKQYGSKG